jgi:cell division protein FtsL
MNWLNHRVRGFRLVDLIALGVLTALILGVYLAKTMAGRERTEIARIDRQIDAEKARIRLLQAEVSHLEQPARIEALSEAYLGLAPVPMKHEADLTQLPDLARKPLAAPAKPVEVTPDPILTAAPQPAEPLPAPTQMAAIVQPATSQSGVAR